MNRTELLDAIRTGRRTLDETLAGYPDDRMADRIDETWTRKDVIAHFDAWERRVVRLLDRLRRGDPTEPEVETDELNERYWRESRDRPLRDVRAAEHEAYEALLAAIDGATDEELFDGSHFDWTEGDPLAEWFRGNSDEHYAEHLEQLTRPAR
ncbi:MAG TPA: ClbS/DfsB family four-helix bundle protein [Candidatus Limnocylindrales bacterium]|nr:ClbS/DfsB family four-helix bundle protein [Candidatus Limnocylindrales bacterium]